MDDLQLVRRMKAGDRSAFDSIYEKYHVPILRASFSKLVSLLSI